MSGRHRRDRSPQDVAFVDQIEAATEHAERTLRRHAAKRFANEARATLEERDRRDDTTPEGMFLKPLMEEILSGRVLGCEHSGTPQPLFMRAWDKPMELRCGPCEERHWETHPVVGQENFRCDRCGRIEEPDDFEVHEVQWGPVMIGFGLCGPCHGR